jgi:dCTP deaminase
MLETMGECLFCRGSYDNINNVCLKCGLSNVPRTLVDKEIKKLIDMEVIGIYPLLNLERQMNPIGLDLTIDTRYKKLKKSHNRFIDPIKKYKVRDYYDSVELSLANDEQYVLHPGEFTLAQTFEFITLPDYIGAGLDGKSSLGRVSLMVHTTAGSIDPGFKGHITLELFNVGGLPLIIHPLQPVARLIFYLTNRAENPYHGDYSEQTEVRPSMAYKSYFSSILRRREEFIP